MQRRETEEAAAARRQGGEYVQPAGGDGGRGRGRGRGAAGAGERGGGGGGHWWPMARTAWRGVKTRGRVGAGRCG